MDSLEKCQMKSLKNKNILLSIIAVLLAMVLSHVDSAPALKCNGYELESWLSGHFIKKAVCTGEGPVCKCMG